MECIKFAGTKKGERRKTARRAYVPSLKETKRFKINNNEAGEFEIYLDWSTPSEIGLYVYDEDGEISAAVIDLKTGSVAT